ncbi:hypothetical protein, partial [Salinimicrobium sp. WS361]|uniref:hypothetical protein n=1 Tax=Salinimicrobium sp. WS361 TaxID=3425123 RepID=UPI003D6E4BA2
LSHPTRDFFSVSFYELSLSLKAAANVQPFFKPTRKKFYFFSATLEANPVKADANLQPLSLNFKIFFRELFQP